MDRTHNSSLSEEENILDSLVVSYCEPIKHASRHEECDIFISF